MSTWLIFDKYFMQLTGVFYAFCIQQLTGLFFCEVQVGGCCYRIEVSGYKIYNILGLTATVHL